MASGAPHQSLLGSMSLGWSTRPVHSSQSLLSSDKQQPKDPAWWEDGGGWGNGWSCKRSWTLTAKFWRVLTPSHSFRKRNIKENIVNSVQKVTLELNPISYTSIKWREVKLAGRLGCFWFGKPLWGISHTYLKLELTGQTLSSWVSGSRDYFSLGFLVGSSPDSDSVKAAQCS